MRVECSQPRDIPKIFELYRIATEYMKSKNQVHWPEFQESLIANEIEEFRQWKMIIDEEIACIWAIAFKDELIWADGTKDPSLYIHRIATNPIYRGRNLVKELVNWANQFGKGLSLKYIRMDTVGLNQGLIGHYQKFGFEFLGTKTLVNTRGLPAHYKDGEVCYFQKKII